PSFPPRALTSPFSSRRACARMPAPHSPRLHPTPSPRTASAAAPLRSAAAPPFPPAELRLPWRASLGTPPPPPSTQRASFHPQATPRPAQFHPEPPSAAEHCR